MNHAHNSILPGKLKRNIPARLNDSNKDPIVQFILDNEEKWQEALKEREFKRNQSKRILIATSMASYVHGAMLDRRLAIALTEKGFEIAFLICDANLQACQIIKHESISPIKLISSENTPRCKKCAPLIEELFSPLKLPIFNFVENSQDKESFENELNGLNMEELQTLTWQNMSIGQHSRAGAIRYFATTQFQKEPHAREILLRFIRSSKRVIDGMNNVQEQFKADLIVAHHGIYVPQGIIADYCKANRIQLMTWTPSYRKHTFIFSPEESYHFSMASEPVENWEMLDPEDWQWKALDEYIRSRSRGEQDWIKFSDSRLESKKDDFYESGFFLALTSVTWDAELHYESRAFKNMREWLKVTVDYFRENPNERLIIRIHPAELTSAIKSREPAIEFLRDIGAHEMTNVRIVLPEDSISTYSLIDKAKAVIVFNTKTGIEASYLGKTVVTAGEAWIKGKGISLDAYNKEQYLKFLDECKLSSGSSSSRNERARKYAYHFFFRRMIRIKLIENSENGTLLPEREITWNEMIGKDDTNFLEILKSIEEYRIPIAKEI